MISLFHVLQTFLSGDGALILPELELFLFAIGILVIDRWLAPHEKYWNGVLALAGTAFGAFTLYVQYGKMRTVRAADPESPGLLGLDKSMVVDPFFLFFAAVFLSATVLIILLSARYLAIEDEGRGRFYALMLSASAGMMLVASGVNAIVVFLGMEVMALSSYSLMCLFKSRANAERAARSFAVLWACSSVALALGFLLLYGEFRTTNLGRMGAILDVRLDHGVAFAGLTNWHAVLALTFLAAGAFFLIDAAPLHWLAPEIYEFAPTPVTAFFSTAAKTAGFALLLRLFAFLFLFAHQKWMHVWGGVAILSLLWGNIAALRQRNVMRMLAYGAVAHTGFILLGLVAANETGFNGMAFYIGANAFSTIGAFGVLMVLGQQGPVVSSLADLNGLYRRKPAAAWLLLLFLLSLAGVPPTAGFLAKFYIVRGLLAAPHPELAAFAVVNALLAVFYYGRMAAHAFKEPSVGHEPILRQEQPVAAVGPLTMSNGQTVALTAAAFVSLAAGLYPAPFLRLASYVFGQ